MKTRQLKKNLNREVKRLINNLSNPNSTTYEKDYYALGTLLAEYGYCEMEDNAEDGFTETTSWWIKGKEVCVAIYNCWGHGTSYGLEADGVVFTHPDDL